MAHKDLDAFHAHMREHEMDYLRTRTSATCAYPGDTEGAHDHADCIDGLSEVTVTVTLPRQLAPFVGDAIALHVDGRNDAGAAALVSAAAAFHAASLAHDQVLGKPQTDR